MKIARQQVFLVTALICMLVLSAPVIAGAAIVIDAGHGGKDPGAVSGGVYEKDVNLAISKLVVQELQKYGYRVKATRDSDVYLTLQQRCDISNNSHAAVFVSIHQNSSLSSGASGVEVYHYPSSTLGNKLAGKILNRIVAKTGLKNRGVKSADYYVLRNTEAIAALVECGFISNPEERDKLTDPSFQKKIAQAVAAGINGFILEDLYTVCGSNRFGTAAEISKKLYAAADAVVLVNGLDFPDALSAAPFARLVGGPLLLVTDSSLPAETEAELRRLHPAAVYIVGGEKAVGSTVVNRIKAVLPSTEVKRIYGQTRFETSVRVAEEMARITTPTAAYLVSGFSFPDALSVSALAARTRNPILLVSSDMVPPEVLGFIESHELTEVVVVGGPLVISNEALRDLSGYYRIAGKNRFETAALVQTHAIEKYGFSAETMIFVSGTGFADALTAAQLSEKLGAPMLLAGDSCPSPETLDFLTDNLSRLEKIYIIGGTAAISRACRQQLILPFINRY